MNLKSTEKKIRALSLSQNYLVVTKKNSSTKNLRSARTESPGETMSKNHELNVINLSHALPPQPTDKKLISPLGVMPIRYFKVFVLLQFE